MGIDAHVELVERGNPTGKLAALQIKTGASHFNEKKHAFVYYGKNEHLDYWLNHSLPVLFVAHFPSSGVTLWVHVTEKSVVRTKKAWKVEIPKSNIFGTEYANSIAEVFEGTSAQHEMRRLAIDEPMMRHIVDRGRVSVRFEDWINKSLGRTPVEVFVYDENGDEELSREWFLYYRGFGPKGLVEALFPWATAVVDQEFYDENSRAIDEDNGVSYQCDPEEHIYPYDEAAGEVEYYQLKLTLNDLGNAFLVLSDHLREVS